MIVHGQRRVDARQVITNNLCRMHNDARLPLRRGNGCSNATVAGIHAERAVVVLCAGASRSSEYAREFQIRKYADITSFAD